MNSETSDQPIKDDEQEGEENEDEEEDPKPQVVDSMKLEEEKLKSKYPPNTRLGGTAFLQKRLNKGGMKYFDSGDYNMAKAKGQQKARLPVLQQPTGEAIPTPDNLPTRKTSLVQSKLATGESMVADD